MTIYNYGIVNIEEVIRMNKRQYSRGELQDAAALASILMSVSEAKRPMFSLAVESMVLGAEMAEGRQNVQGCTLSQTANRGT